MRWFPRRRAADPDPVRESGAELAAAAIGALPLLDQAWRRRNGDLPARHRGARPSDPVRVAWELTAWDGRRRAAAIGPAVALVRRAPDDPLALRVLGLLLVRRNDWAAPVAAAADGATRGLLAELGASTWFAVLELLPWLDAARRALFAHPSAIDAAGLRTGLATPQVRGTRRELCLLQIRQDRHAALAPLVRAAADGDAGFAIPRIAGILRRDPGFGARRPHAALRALREALDDCGAALPPDLRRVLAWLTDLDDPSRG